MTVKELIKKLSKLPEEAVVVTRADDPNWIVALEEVQTVDNSQYLNAKKNTKFVMLR